MFLRINSSTVIGLIKSLFVCLFVFGLAMVCYVDLEPGFTVFLVLETPNCT